MMIDDLAGGLRDRHEARKVIDDLLEKPYPREKEEIDVDAMRENWGNTPEAIAQAESSFWDT